MRRVAKSIKRIKRLNRFKKHRFILKIKSFFRKIKKLYRQLKYMDRTKVSYFVVTSFIGLFCTFTMATYSAFTFTKTLNAALITVGKLSYTLTSASPNFSNGVVSVPAGETVIVPLNLASANSINSKYALGYQTANTDVAVYYSYDIGDNMNGTIGATGSNIDMKIVIVNSGNTAATVNLSVLGGYEYNTLTASNITNGYYEADIITRLYTLDSNMGNKTRVNSVPADTTAYRFLKAECNNHANVSWDSSNWKLNLEDVDNQVVCDVYFKEMTNDLEVYYMLQETTDINESFNTVAGELTTTTPTSAYHYYKTVCTSGSGTYNNGLTVSGFDANTICVAYFDKATHT